MKQKRSFNTMNEGNVTCLEKDMVKLKKLCVTGSKNSTLASRAFSLLRRKNITSIEKFKKINIHDLSTMPGCGKVTLEVFQNMEKYLEQKGHMI